MKNYPGMICRTTPALIWTSLLLVGCTGTKDTVLPVDGPTMMSIYDRHMKDMQSAGSNGNFGGQPLPASGYVHYQGYMREAANEIDSLFPRLPNPTLVMFVFPHLSRRERTPIPGYATSFPLYERVEYALPGEVPMAAEISNRRPRKPAGSTADESPGCRIVAALVAAAAGIKNRLTLEFRVASTETPGSEMNDAFVPDQANLLPEQDPKSGVDPEAADKVAGAGIDNRADTIGTHSAESGTAAGTRSESGTALDSETARKCCDEAGCRHESAVRAIESAPFGQPDR